MGVYVGLPDKYVQSYISEKVIYRLLKKVTVLFVVYLKIFLTYLPTNSFTAGRYTLLPLIEFETEKSVRQ